MWHWLVVAAILAGLVWLLKSGRSSNSPQAPVAQYVWPPLGDYDFEVVGESHHQRVLKALRDSVSNPNQPATGTAILAPENDNPYDNKAVRVTVGGHTIGHLSRDDARSYRRRLVKIF